MGFFRRGHRKQAKPAEPELPTEHETDHPYDDEEEFVDPVIQAMLQEDEGDEDPLVDPVIDALIQGEIVNDSFDTALAEYPESEDEEHDAEPVVAETPVENPAKFFELDLPQEGDVSSIEDSSEASLSTESSSSYIEITEDEAYTYQTVPDEELFSYHTYHDQESFVTASTDSSEDSEWEHNFVYPKTIPSPTDSYKLVSLSFLVPNVPTGIAARTFEESFRILKPGGVMYVVDLDGRTVQRNPRMRQFLRRVRETREEQETTMQQIIEQNGFEISLKSPRIARWMGIKKA